MDDSLSFTSPLPKETQEQLESAYRQWSALTYTYARHATGQDQSASTITRKVFVEAARAHARTGKPTVLSLPRLLQETRRQLMLLGSRPETAVEADGTEIRARLDRLVASDVIRNMPHVQRRALDLALLDRLTASEIAGSLGQAECEIRRLLAAALFQLRTEMARNE
ncbi:MAG TPA: hypothetical protein DCQ36_04320 [Actinobacteria bacterium]|nr:hypothetical protein [Actinomycetota bacterium]